MASVKEAKVNELELAESHFGMDSREMERRIKAEKQLLKQQRGVKWQ